MRVLGIETSCDETAICLLEAEGDTDGATYKILGNALFSQAHLHAAYGGVYPNLAKREHQKNLPLLLAETLHQAKPKLEEAGGTMKKSGPQAEGETGDPRTFSAALAAALGIDLIAVTRGPGLEPALWTGITFAEELGKKWDVSVIGVDHMEGHICSALMRRTESTTYHISNPKLPLLALLISGGHTEFVFMHDWFRYELIGKTRDDSVGEAFDKVARMLGLGYPGGPALAALAATARKSQASNTKSETIKFPRPMAHDDTCDFSFSGLKTAVLYKLRTMGEITDADKASVAHAFEDAVRDVIVTKTRRALEKTAAATLVVGGGVSANTEIRKGLETLIEEEFLGTVLSYPDPTLTGDNAIMIAVAGHLRHVRGHMTPGPLQAEGSRSLS